MDEFAFKVGSHVSFVVVVIVVGFAYIGREAAATVVLPEKELQSKDAEYGEDEGEDHQWCGTRNYYYNNNNRKGDGGNGGGKGWRRQ